MGLPEKVAQLSEIQSDLTKAKATQDKIPLLPKATSKKELEKRAAFELVVKKEIAELSEILGIANAEIAADTKEIEGLRNAKSAYLEKLNKQIKVLAELGVEKDLSSKTAEILKGVDVFEQMLSAQKGVANAQKNVKTNASTPESIRPKKLEKLQGLATSAKTNLESALANPETDISEIPKLKKRAAAANKALELYKLEISDPAKEIEKLNQKLANGNAQLAKNIQELQQRLTQAIPALFREASQEVVKVGNLNEIAQHQNLVAPPLAQKEKSVAQKAKEIKQFELAIAKNEFIKFKLDKLPATDSSDELKKREGIRASADKNIAENKAKLEQAKKTLGLPEKAAIPTVLAQIPVVIPPLQSQVPVTIPHAPTKPKTKAPLANYDTWDLDEHEYSQSLESNAHKENLERSLKAVKTDKYMMATPKGLLDIQEQNQLSDAEIKVLQAYTQGPYRLINAYLREGKVGLEKELKRIQEANLKLGSEKVNQLYGGDYNLPVEELETHIPTLARSLQSTLGKLPNHNGVVFRGEGAKEDVESIQQRLSQEELTSQAFTSSGVQEGFAGKAQYAIKSKSGKMIQVPGAQGVDKAGEVMHGQGQKFRIVSQQSAASELAIPSSFSATEAELIKQTFTPEKLKSLGAEVIVFLEEIDTVVEESLVAIKEATPKTKASYKAWDSKTPTMKEALATDNLSHAYTRGKKLAPQLSKQYGLNADEEAALAAYTATGLFDAINSYLRGGTAGLQKAVDKAKQRMSEKRESGLSEKEIQKRLLTDFPIKEGLEERIKVYAETLSSALGKLPASHQNDLVFRGTGSTDAVKEHLPGSEHVFPAFTSVAEKNPFSTPAQLVILPKSAKNITPFAPLANLGKELGGASFGSELALDRNTRTRVIARKELSLPEKSGEAPLDLSSIQGLSKEHLHKIQSQYTPEFIKSSGTEIIVILEEIQKEVGSALEDAVSAIASVQKEIQPIAHEFLNIPKVELPSPQSSPGLEFNSSKDVHQFASKNLNAKGMKDLARRMGIDTKNTNKEYLLNEITSLSGTADSRKQIAQLISQLAPDKFLSASNAKPAASSSADASKAIGELKKARKVLADALKIAQGLDVKDRQLALEQLIKNAALQEAIAKQLSSEYQLTPAHSKSLGGVRSQFKNISDQSKQSLAAIQANENPGDVGLELGANLVSAIGSGMSTAAVKPIKEIQSVMGAIEGAAKDKAEIRSPSRVFQRIGKFIAQGLALGITQGSPEVKNAIGSLINEAATVSLSKGKSLLPTPPPPPGFNLPITRTTVPPPPPGFNLPIGKPTQTPPPPPGFNLPIGTLPAALVLRTKKDQELNQIVEDILRRQSQSKAKSPGLPLPTPPAPPDFNLPIKVKQLVDKIKDSGELFKIVVDIQKDQTKNIQQKLKEYDQIIKIYDDLEAEKAKQNQVLDDKFDPEKIDRQRETITQRAKLSAKLERKYGMEGLAPEILPDRINNLGEVQKSPSILQGIKDIFKSLDNSVAKRVKKRAAQLAIEVDTAIAPSLEAGAIDAGARGDKVEQKQYQKLARQSRAATTGIAKILESPGDLTDKQVKQLDRLTSQLEKVYDAIGRPLPSQGFLESIGVGAGGAIGLVKNLGGVIKGFLAFSIGMWAQNFFGSIAQETFKAYVELDRLKTALNFASGGAAGGAQNLAFVRKTVDDLGIPLKASTEGFTQLAAAARGTSLEGKETREIFKGMSEASTVLGLSAEDTQGAMMALEQMISKGKIGADDYRQQLGTRLPGAMGLLARAAGVTETELNRLMESGQAITQDLFPKLSRQFHAEYGEEAKTAGHNAQSSIFKVQNAFLGLQQGIGEGVSPAAIAGLDALSDVLEQVAKVGKEIAIIITAVSAALLLNLGKALWTIIGELILTKAAGATLGGAFSQLASTINNSFSAQITVGVFALLEAINLVNSAVNTELVKSFQKAADSAKRAAEESRKAFGDPGKKPEKDDEKSGESSTKPVASSWFGQFMDSYVVPTSNLLMPGINPNIDFTKRGGGLFKRSNETFASKEQSEMQGGTGALIGENANLAIDTRKAIKQLQSRTGDVGRLPAVDADLQKAEQQRQILQAQIKRDYADKGVAVPASSKQNLDALNIKIQQLNDQRAEIAKPYSLQITRLDRQINDTKSAREALKTPEAIKTAGGTEAAARMDDQLKSSYELLKGVKAQAESALAALRVDPIQAFTNALRSLNLGFAEGQEKNQLTFDASRATISAQQVTGFKTNKFSSKTAAVNVALQEKEKAGRDYQDQQAISKGLDAEVNKPQFQTTLQRLGVSPDASAARIDDVLKNTTDESDKGILEKLKTSREQKNKLSVSRGAYSDSMQKVQSTVQDFHSFQIDEKASDSSAAIQKNENLQTASIKRSLEDKVIVEEVANEQIAKIQLKTTQDQRKNLDDQLNAVRADHEAGFMSAEEFAKKERDLTTQQTALEKQEAENRLAVQSAALARRLKEIEFYNKKAEALTGTKQAESTRIAKEKLLSSGLTPQAQDQFSLDQTKIDGVKASDDVAQVKDRIAQNKELYETGKRDARDFMLERYALNQELAKANLAVVEQEITAEEKYRDSVEHAIQRIMQAEENRFRKQQSQLDESKAKLDFYNQSLERTTKLEQSRNNLSKALSDARITPLENQKADTNDDLGLIEKLKDKNISRQEKAAIKAKLREHGIENRNGLTVTPATITKSTGAGGDETTELELQAKENVAGIEKAIALAKQEAMTREQEFQKKTLENDLRRQQIAAQIALYDAQGYQLAAQKSKLEAEAALKVAIAKKDPVAIETAKVGVELANKEIVLSSRRVESAQANLNDQPEIAANATLEQKVTQGTENQNFQAGEKRRQRATAFDLFETGDKGGRPMSMSDAEAKAGTINPTFALPQKIELNPMPKLDLKPGESIFDAYQRQRDGMLAQPLVEKLSTQGAVLPSSKADIPPVDKTTLALNSTSIQPRESAGGNQFVEALKMANQGIEQRLDRLINAMTESMVRVANTPRSISISSPNPFDDAAKLINDMSRGQVMAAGV